MFQNATKAKIEAGQPTFGLIVRALRGSEAVLVAKATGHDFLFLDVQHSLFDPESIVGITMCAIGQGVTPLVRVRGYDDPDIPRYLDAGVMGLIVPDVSNAEQARKVVRASKFAPIGARSFAAPSPLLSYAPVPAPEAARQLNDNVLIVCMIENRDGVKNVSEIAAVEGVDVLHVGCTDLLLELGKPGEFGCPELNMAIDAVLAACRDSGKAAGFGGDRNIERQSSFLSRGGRFVTTQSDVGLLLDGGKRVVDALRHAAAG